MVDAARLADELRAEQEHASSQEKAKRSLESSIAELDQRLAEANDIAAKGGRNAMAKLESRIRELEIELGSCQSKTSENYKAFQKAERRIKELQFQQDEDHKNQDRMSELANKLQIRSTKMWVLDLCTRFRPTICAPDLVPRMSGLTRSESVER